MAKNGRYSGGTSSCRKTVFQTPRLSMPRQTCNYSLVKVIGGWMKKLYLPLVCLGLLAGCSDAGTELTAQDLIADTEASSSDAPRNKFGFAEALHQGPSLLPDAPVPARDSGVRVIPKQSGSAEATARASETEGGQQIAYSYGFGFRIAGDHIAELQEAHIATCEAMGEKCRVLRTSQARTDLDAFGEINLQVASDQAGSLENALSDPAEKLGGELMSSVRDGEDLSENIVDTQARLNSRLVLRKKLTAVLQNSKGSTAELIKAEEAVADVNEQIDATRAKLQQYRNRIRFSDVRITYEPEYGQSRIGFAQPVMEAAGSIGTTLGITIGFLIYAITALVPIALLVLAIRWVLHRFGYRIRFWMEGSKG